TLHGGGVTPSAAKNQRAAFGRRGSLRMTVSLHAVTSLLAFKTPSFFSKPAYSPEFLANRANFADYSGYADRSDCAAGCALRHRSPQIIRVKLMRNMRSKLSPT